MTEGEIGWLMFIQGKYSIADWVMANMDEDGILTFNCPFEMAEALNDDMYSYKAVMLSDDTALQKLFFWLGNDDIA